MWCWGCQDTISEDAEHGWNGHVYHEDCCPQCNPPPPEAPDA